MQPTHDICPYSLRPLKDLAKTNAEHIFPDAIGGVLDYSIQVDETKNSELGTRLDAPLISSPLIAGQRMVHGIKSRSGQPAWKMRGKVKGTNKTVDLTIPSDGPVRWRIRNPVEIDRATGEGTVTFPQSDRNELLGKLVADYARKGKTVVFGSEMSLGDQIEVDWSFESRLIKRALLKIAYAAVYEFIGDDFLKDSQIAEWQKALFAPTDEEAMTAKIHGVAFDSADMLRLILPDLQPHEHAVAVANLQLKGLVVAVSLFGQDFHRLLAFASESSNFGLGVGEGRIAICDAKAGKTAVQPFMDHFVSRANAIFPPLSPP